VPPTTMWRRRPPGSGPGLLIAGGTGRPLDSPVLEHDHRVGLRPGLGHGPDEAMVAPARVTMSTRPTTHLPIACIVVLYRPSAGRHAPGSGNRCVPQAPEPDSAEVSPVDPNPEYNISVSASAVIAVVSAAITVAVTIFGIFERNRAFRAEQRRHQVLLQNLEQYKYRAASYAGVFKTLGAISDMVIPEGPNRYRTLLDNRELLQSTADSLLGHLYSNPGLLMTMETRNHLHTARAACLSFLASGGSEAQADDLVNDFYYARRILRADLDLIDDRTPAKLQTLVDELDARAKGS
jgi:hypothetical protein